MTETRSAESTDRAAATAQATDAAQATEAAEATLLLERWRACWTSPLHLAVVDGPDAGTGLALPQPAHEVVVGRDPRADLPVADPALARTAACVKVRGPDRVRVSAPPEQHARLHRSRWPHCVRVSARGRPWQVGEALVIGGTRVVLRAAPSPTAPASTTLRGDEPGSGAATSPTARRLGPRLLMLLPSFSLVLLLLRPRVDWSGAITWAVIGLIVAVLCGVTVAWWWRRRSARRAWVRAECLDPTAPPDPAAFAVWCAGTGHAPSHHRRVGLGAGAPAAAHARSASATALVYAAHGRSFEVGDAVVIHGPAPGGLARWLRACLGERVTVRAGAHPGDVAPHEHALSTVGSVGVSPAWSAAIESVLRPRTVGLRDLLGDVDEREIARSWRGRAQPGGSDNLAVTIARGPSGAPFTLDLAAAPHAIIAGTTGSGKSELLAAWAYALALRHAPRDLALLLVDYKGGATFGPLAGLPHVVGTLTDLAASTAHRALAALRHEVRRREHILARAGARDVAEYRAHGGRLGRLVVMVDELRALVEDDAERLADLVAVATLGRSLGIHLVLATQRPSGVISGQLRANLGLRVCLRVTDPGDSVDVVGHPGAAQLVRAGAAFVVPGPSAPVAFAALGPRDRGELSSVVLSAAGRVRRSRHHELLQAHRPWLPPLRNHVTRAMVAATVLLDRPESLRHEAWTWDGGLLVAAGPPGSGRSTALRALVGQALRSGRICHVLSREGWGVGAEGSTGGTVVGVDDPARMTRLLARLAAGADPEACLAVDDIEQVSDAVDSVTRPGTGAELLTALVRTRRAGWLALGAGTSHRWASSAAYHLVLGLHDPAWTSVAGVRAAFDARAGAGRGMLVRRGDQALAQVVIDDCAPSAPPARAGVQILALPQRVVWDETGPEVTGPREGLAHQEASVQRDGVRPRGERRADGSVPVALGIGGDASAVLHRWLRPGEPWLVVGPHGSGRTTALRTIAAGLRAGGVEAEVATARSLACHASWAPTALLIDDAEHLPTGWAPPAGVGVWVLATTPSALAGAFRGPLAAPARTVVALGGWAPPELGAVPREPAFPGRGLLIEDGRATPLQIAALAGDVAPLRVTPRVP